MRTEEMFIEYQNLYVENIAEEELRSLLQKSGIENFAYIIHNSDVKSDGTLKKPHYHCVFEFDPTTHKGFKKDLETLLVPSLLAVSNRFEKVTNLKAFLRYFTHVDDANKFQYSSEDIYFNNEYMLELYYEKFNEQKKGVIDLLIEKMCDEITNDYMAFATDFDDKTEISAVKRLWISNRMTRFMFNFWKSNGHLSYYVQHRRNVDEMARIAIDINLC